MKTCSKCKIEKDEIDFCKDKKRRDGLNLWCRSCSAEHYQRNKLRIRKTNKLYRDTHRERVKEARKEYFQCEDYKTNKSNYDKRYRIENAVKIREYKKAWANVNKNDPVLRIKKNLRRRIHHVVASGYKSASTERLIGCTYGEFKTHLESLFTSGMSWSNYGHRGWHIDHIRPCCDFDLTKPKEQLKCFHYTNCQPLWEADNLRKAYISDGKNCRAN